MVPTNHVLLESGFQYQKLINPEGTQQNGPSAVLRLGLPANNELFLLLPNFIDQSPPQTSGFSATTFGLKHEFVYYKNWTLLGEVMVIPPSVSDAFGSEGLGVTFNAIINYSLNTQWSLLTMLSASTMTQPYLDGGKRFESFNPDVVLSYAPFKKISIYGEIYGQTQTGPNQGSGFNSLFGFSYLIARSVVIDLEVSQRISGQLGGFERYIGSGISIYFG